MHKEQLSQADGGHETGLHDAVDNEKLVLVALGRPKRIERRWGYMSRKRGNAKMKMDKR